MYIDYVTKKVDAGIFILFKMHKTVTVSLLFTIYYVWPDPSLSLILYSCVGLHVKVQWISKKSHALYIEY
jgi:hypothetical protein